MLDDSHLRVITRPLKTEDGYTVAHMQAAMSLDTVDEASQQLKKIMILGSGIALFVSVILGDWLARRALRPIANITRTADHIIVAEDLNSRIPYDGPMDEIGSLITTLNQMISRLEASFNTQQRFVGDVSHELRTPLTAIQSHVDLIERYGLTGKDDKSLKFVKSEVRRMSRLVGDLLTLAQADMGQLPVIETEVQLDTLLLDLYSQAKILSQDKVKIALGDFDQILVRGDEDRLQQLLLNLVTNALKFTPEGGTIKLSLRQTPTHAEIEVKDTGIGIPPDDLPHIFDRFYRVDKARARAMGGAGLGLSIAKWIADIHQGDLRVESVVGEGTTFTLALPLHPEDLSDDPAKENNKQRFSSLRLKRSEVH
jgi:two-component system, OmpR family, sensor kinase